MYHAPVSNVICPRSLGLLLLSLTHAACTPVGQPQVVVPTAPALSEAAHGDRIAVRTLHVAFAGAQGAPDGLERTEEEASERAQMLVRLARADGEDFNALEAKYSDRPPLADPGPVGLVVERGKGPLDPAVEAAAFGLSQEQISAPIRTDAGFVIVLRTKDPPKTPPQVAARHILLSYEGARGAADSVTRTKEEALELAGKLAAEVQAEGADWNALHAEHSDEPGNTHGDLGTFARGQMVPEFERAVFALEVGDYSGPVESPFGFHVIQRYK